MTIHVAGPARGRIPDQLELTAVAGRDQAACRSRHGAAHDVFASIQRVSLNAANQVDLAKHRLAVAEQGGMHSKGTILLADPPNEGPEVNVSNLISHFCPLGQSVQHPGDAYKSERCVQFSRRLFGWAFEGVLELF